MTDATITYFPSIVAGCEINELEKNDILSAIEGPGAVLLRGVKGSLDGFSDLVSRCSSSVTLDPARSFHGVAQKVDAGTHAMGMHLENGATPFVPDLVWFYCNRGPQTPSATTVCDGIAALASLPSEVADQFRDNRVMYKRSVPEQAWRLLASRLSSEKKEPSEVTFEDLVSCVPEGQECRFTLQTDGSAYYEYATFTVHGDQFLGRPAFAHSIFGPSYNYEPPIITFEDGRPFTESEKIAAQEALDAHTLDISWETGDLVVIDNSRVMHGRRQITDTNREIFNALSYI